MAAAPPEHSSAPAGGLATQIPAQPDDHVEVRIVETETGPQFEPQLAWVKPEGSITWTLEDGAHSATAYHPVKNDRPLRIPRQAALFDTGRLDVPGEAWEHMFVTEGVYDYYCRYDEAAGMVGSVVVGRPELTDQPGMQEPAESLPPKARQRLATLTELTEQMLASSEGDR